MGILFRLSYPGLFHTFCSQPLTKGIRHRNFMERNLLVGNCRVIVRKTYIGNLLSGPSVKAFEIVVTESSRNLPGPVRTEVKEDNRIAVLYGCYWLSVFHCQSGLHKLIRLSPFIGLRNAADAACRRKSLTLCHGIICQLHPIIIVVPVHGIITPHHRRDFTHTNLFHLCSQSFRKLFAAGRRRVTPIQETMHIHLFKTVFLRQLQQSIQMRIVTVYTAVG